MLNGPVMNARIADTARFYDLLERLAVRVDGLRVLADCTGRMRWPPRGVYFFFEDGETRSGSGSGHRVVRVGTHALVSGSRATLWRRLSQHRGSARSRGGNHRGSIFRLLVGAALAQEGDLPLPPSWGRRGRPTRLDRVALKRDESGLEALVSRRIGAMPFLWLGVDDAPGPGSRRARIECNAIALLSGAAESALDPPSPRWLGCHSDREPVRRSGLWNIRHTDEGYDPLFLDVLEDLIGETDPPQQAAPPAD